MLALLLPALRRRSPQDYPKLKAGLWEMERSAERAARTQLNRMTMCLDDSVQKEMFDMGAGAMQGMCSKHDFKLSGNRGTGDFICDIGGSRMHSKSTMAMTGNTSYRTEIRTTYDPPFMGQTEYDDGPDRAPRRRLQARPAAGRHGACRTARRSTCATPWARQRRCAPKHVRRPAASPEGDRQPG